MLQGGRFRLVQSDPMKKSLPVTLRIDEQVLVRIEQAPWSALYRIGIGYAILPVFYLLFGSNVPAWWIIVWFLSVLLTLRLIPAIARKMIPFSGTVRGCWTENRQFAKDFDSYQWQKLVWFGVGLAGYVMSSGYSSDLVKILIGFCLLTGGVGFCLWQRKILSRQNPDAR